jgi:hypothetical protein
MRKERCATSHAQIMNNSGYPIKQCSEPRTVLMPSFESMRTSFLTRAVADLVSRSATDIVANEM